MHPGNVLVDMSKDMTKDELIFKEYYTAKNNPDLFAEFLGKQTPSLQMSMKYWLKTENGDILSELTENTKELDFVNNVIVHRHSRYCPAFVHKHTFFEIIVVIAGSCVNCIDNQNHLLEEGDVCIIAPGEYHAIKDSKDSIIYNILIKHYNFSDTFSSFLLQSNVLSSFFMQVLYGEKGQKCITFHTKGDMNLQMLFDILILECTQGKNNMHISSMSESLLNTIFNCLAMRHSNSQEHNTVLNFDSQLMLKIKQYISENMKDASLASLSEEFNYSPTYLSKLVKKVTGYNLSNIIRRIRIDKACSLLSNTDLSVAEISEIVGYKSTRQFNRAFHALLNKTPTEYRKRNSSPLL